MGRTWKSIILAVALIARASSAHGAWAVDANGACVEQWSSSDLLRGPTAIVNAPLLPVRTLAGGAEYAWTNTEWWPWQIALLGPAVTLFSAAAGAVEAVWWVGTGMADTLTGGYFAIAPEPATELSVRPKVPGIIVDAQPPPAPQDRCGRPL
jgi:hypothetical protein